ncbi:hypothetical protein C8A01DRAFT_20330 [Parachaetomium inaequale]|uniref:Transcription factor Iwr1 domain-containing protein n=1 Tax=Parachaetomium inaequale TaxID=2588326 RepID=A0AAN6PA62_9PEZI|nr:hypothetical protein C8A01DRAFT_20330 [Parachaetomium inaequale]
MASLPPDTIQVKRKRGSDEDAVDFLRLEESKRSRSSDDWVYQRKQVDGGRATTLKAEPSAPVIQPTREGDESRLLRHPRKPTQAPARNDATTSGATPVAPTTSSQPTTDRIRRFHLARSNSPQPAAGAGVSKKRAVPAVFIERGAKKQRETLKTVIQERNVTPTEPPKPAGGSEPPEPSNSADEKPPAPSPVKYKRPGNRASTYTPNNKPALPPSMRGRENTDMDALAESMDAWTLDEITKNLNRMKEQSTTSKYSPATSRFKPKAPKQRYFERHPESLAQRGRGKAAVQQAPAGPTAMDVDAGVGDTTDEEDYVLETYERVPAERLRDQTVPAHRVGLLVFDTEPDMVEFFYGNEGDSDEDLAEGDEDENAENHYTADYPEDELDSDDELDRNPYGYTNQNDSDMEEYDERDYEDEGFENGNPVGGFRGQINGEWTP